MIPTTLRGSLAALAGSILAIGLFAQTAPKLELPVPSQAATVKQRVGVTDIEINYSRPSMKGRKIFGEFLPYGVLWRTGANTATKISFSTPVNFGGTEVPAGDYGLFTIPGKDEWTVILNKIPGQWGSYAYAEKDDVLRVKVKPIALATPYESFTIGLNDLREDSATLNLLWENTRVQVKLTVDTLGMVVPKVEAFMASDEKKTPEAYFGAAMFYYENNHDLKKALTWVDAGLALKPDAFYMVYRKGLILAKLGDKAGAVAAAKQSLEMVAKMNGELKDEYTRLNNALIASVK
ncbi:MAG TPA: DUF2911 domain-containing protein [Candidatus Didemnitutus sp.]|nr:DUF2911 domain-containing protein [Candidatus Didemnitutus sp.]